MNEFAAWCIGWIGVAAAWAFASRARSKTRAEEMISRYRMLEHRTDLPEQPACRRKHVDDWEDDCDEIKGEKK